MLVVVLGRQGAGFFSNYFPAASQASVDTRMNRNLPRLKDCIESFVFALREPITVLVESHSGPFLKCGAELDL